MPSRTGPTLDSPAPDSATNACIASAARAARSSWQLAVEEQEQRVAAELEHVAAVAPADLDQAGVAPADQRDQLLGSELAALREALGERGEARDVQAEQRRVEDRAISSPWSRCQVAARRGTNGRSAEAVAVVTSPPSKRVRQFDRDRAAEPLHRVLRQSLGERLEDLLVHGRHRLR